MASPQQPDSYDYSRSSTIHGHDSDSPEKHALLPFLSNPHPLAGISKRSRALVYEAPVSKKSDFSRRWMSPRTVVPSSVLVVHTALLIFSWSFFGATLGKPVALPVSLATKAKERFQSVILVTTLLASTIALISSVYYAKAIRYSLARFLAKRVSLFTVASAVRMSQASLIKNFRRPRWTVMAFICLVALNAQTAGWTTLMTPKTIEIQSRVTGYELDLKSPAFQNLFAASNLSTGTNPFPQVVGAVEASGSTAVATCYHLPSALNFNHFSYNNSTMGIMPVAMEEIDSKILSTNGTKLPVRVDVKKERETPKGFSTRFLLTQQGFTAQVSCQQRTLDNTTQPSLALLSANEMLSANGATVTLAQIEVVCPGATVQTCSEPILTSTDMDAVFAISCPVKQTDGRNRWDLILVGSGKYKPIDTMICSIFPQTTLVNVNYTGNTMLLDSSYPKFINGSEPWGGEDAPWLGNYSLSVFLHGLKVGQSTSGNAMGDSVLSFLSNMDIPSDRGTLEVILAQYIRGAVEVGATILRTAYTEDNNRLYQDESSDIPTNMRSTINGSYWAETIGWHQAPDTAATVLIAPTWVSLTAICIIAFTLVKKKGDREPEVNRYFDPNDLLHVISAASAGGMSVNFPAYDEKTENYSESITVTLAPVRGPGTKSGFVNHDVSESQIEEHQP